MPSFTFLSFLLSFSSTGVIKFYLPIVLARGHLDIQYTCKMHTAIFEGVTDRVLKAAHSLLGILLVILLAST